jgi:serine/threonine-protein kinase HipA
MKKLTVLYKGWGQSWPLGTLADNGRALLFEYSAQALQQGLELSPRHLKLRAGAYGDFPAHLWRLPGLVADALPDGWGLLLMDKQFRRAGQEPSAVSVLDRLALIGGNAMGALAFEPALGAATAAQDWSLLALAQEVHALQQEAQHGIAGDASAALAQLALLGGSPQGARPKVLVNVDAASGMVSAKPQAAGTPWLVKFAALGEHPEVCATEALYAALAAQCGMQVPATRYFAISPTLSALGSERFDRHGGLRVPTHTLAGLLHADFRLPSVDATTFLRATRFLTRDEREVRKAYLRCVFNVAFHNRDDHAKNVSFCLTQDGHWQLSPAYDLTFSHGPGGEHQMDVCGEGGHPARAHLLRLAQEAEVPPDVARTTIATVCGVAAGFAKRAEAFDIRQATVRQMDTAVQANVGALLNV